MGTLTEAQPKCLTRLGGRRLLDWQLAALRAGGIEAVTVISGYRQEMLASSNYALLHNPDWAQTNMVATLYHAAEQLKTAPCLVSYSDIVYHPDHVRMLAAVDADIVISYDTLWERLWSKRFDNPLADAETFRQENGWLTTIGERAHTQSSIEGQFMGLIKFTPDGWAKVESFLAALPLATRQRLDSTRLLNGLLKMGAGVFCVPVNGRWCEVDSESDLQHYEQLLQQEAATQGRWSHDWRW